MRYCFGIKRAVGFITFFAIKEYKRMLLSMTGFGKAETELADKKIVVEIKSLNSKQFDMNARIPACYRSLELELRRSIAARLERGKVDLTVSVEQMGRDTSMNINVDNVRACKERVLQICRETGLPEPADWWQLLMRFPEVTATETDTEADAGDIEALKDTVARAVDALMNYRRSEGAKLEVFFAERIAAIGDRLAEVPRFETERVEKIRQRITDGLAKLPGVEYDKTRMEQEMIFYIEKLDISEEKQRLTQHLAYFGETMAQPRPGQGKKLGFIAQEMGREINTLGSKSNQAEMQNLVVRMKDQLEQIKEQVLNVM